MARRARLGIIGCGVISETYFKLAPLFKGVEIVACADLMPEAAKAKAKAYSVRAMTIDELLKSADIDAAINLTVPTAHYEVSHAILSAGKHAYSEKPLTLTYAEAKLVAEADKRGLKLACAPDTFLGGGPQTARRLLDKGTIGTVVAGTAVVMSHGMEHWHPNPTFFFQPGAGPIFDVGPYYIIGLVNLLGPVRSVAAMAKKGFAERTVTAQGPMRGKKVKVTTPTTINAILEFASGAQVTLAGSWDVWKHGHGNPIELYGTDGTMLVPDPNFFGGKVATSSQGGDYTDADTTSAAFAAANWPAESPTRANYRMLGVADMIEAANDGREPRASGRLAAHVVDVMESILASAADKKFIKLRSTVDRPPPLTPADARRLMARAK